MAVAFTLDPFCPRTFGKADFFLLAIEPPSRAKKLFVDFGRISVSHVTDWRNLCLCIRDHRRAMVGDLVGCLFQSITFGLVSYRLDYVDGSCTPLQ